MAKLTTNWTNRDRTRFTNCKYTVLPQIGIKNKLGMCLRGRVGPLQGHFSSFFGDGDHHTKADAAGVASNGADDEVKASADDFDDGLFQRSCHAP